MEPPMRTDGQTIIKFWGMVISMWTAYKLERSECHISWYIFEPAVVLPEIIGCFVLLCNFALLIATFKDPTWNFHAKTGCCSIVMISVCVHLCLCETGVLDPCVLFTDYHWDGQCFSHMRLPTSNTSCWFRMDSRSSRPDKLEWLYIIWTITSEVRYSSSESFDCMHCVIMLLLFVAALYVVNM